MDFMAAEGNQGEQCDCSPASELGLEGHAQPRLDFALTVHAQAGDCREAAMAYVSIWLVELRRIKQVEEIPAKPYADALGNGEVLTHIQIHLLYTRPGKWISR